MNALYTPSVERDARIRGWRTLAQGLAVDVLVAGGVAIAAATAGGIEWTSNYWAALGIAVGKSIVVAAVSYLARRAVPPANAPTTGGVAP